MRVIVAFNGDADGLLSQQMLWLAGMLGDAPERITGIKRDVRLLRRIPDGAGAKVFALDISLAANREDALRLLKQGARIFWADHHDPGEPIPHAHLDAHIDTDPATCTALIVDRLLDGRFAPWAVAAAFGDNQHEAAQARAAQAGITGERLHALKELGETLNYGGYGLREEDLHVHPRAMAEALARYEDPWRFAEEDARYARLRAGFLQDRAEAEALAPEIVRDGWALFRLPDAPWARRMIGLLANELARAHPARAHALLLPMAGGYRVSVRAPRNNPRGALRVCRRFATGGGREAAAGINCLPEAELDAFVAAMEDVFGA